MARARRRAYARNRLNLEIVGITAIALAILCSIALALPHFAGAAGVWTAEKLRRLFGGAAALFPVLLGLLGVIAFLEVNVPRMIAGWNDGPCLFLAHRRRCSARAARSAAASSARTFGGRCMRSSVAPGAWILLSWRALADVVAHQREPEAIHRRRHALFRRPADAVGAQASRAPRRVARRQPSLRDAFAFPVRPIVPDRRRARAPRRRRERAPIRRSRRGRQRRRRALR